MKKIYNKTSFALIFILYIFLGVLINSCQKEDGVTLKKDVAVENFQNIEVQKNLINGWIEPEPAKIEHKMLNTMQKENSTPVVWCTVPSHRIFRSVNNGANWYEPNSAARLRTVSVGRSAESVWGVSYNAKNGRIFKWNGSSWNEPNPAASAKDISSYTNLEAMVTSTSGKVYATSNGGASWGLISSESLIDKVSYGNWNNIYALTDFGRVLQYNIYSHKFEYISNTKKFKHIAAGQAPGQVWAIDFNNRIYQSNNFGTIWYEPNSKARAVAGISIGHDKIYVLGGDHHYGGSSKIYASLGNNWYEPNSNALATQISAGLD